LPLRLWRGVVDFIAPPRCLVCRIQLGEASSLCASCWPALRHIDTPVCDVLGTPFAYAQGAGAVSAEAQANPPSWDRARAAVAFDDASRPLVHGLKYHDTQEAGLLMARMMARAGRELLTDTDVIVPVPLHRVKLWKRRFNQSGFLGLRLARLTGKACRTDLLARVKATRPQVGLDTRERRKNVKGAFRVDPLRQAEIAGKKILLVDDVMTTGATAGACAEALKVAGAAQVDVLAFALVLEPRRFHM
jgi:ComF family protein